MEKKILSLSIGGGYAFQSCFVAKALGWDIAKPAGNTQFDFVLEALGIQAIEDKPGYPVFNDLKKEIDWVKVNAFYKENPFVLPEPEVETPAMKLLKGKDIRFTVALSGKAIVQGSNGDWFSPIQPGEVVALNYAKELNDGSKTFFTTFILPNGLPLEVNNDGSYQELAHILLNAESVEGIVGTATPFRIFSGGKGSVVTNNSEWLERANGSNVKYSQVMDLISNYL